MLSGAQGASDRARRGNSPFHNEMAASLVLLSETQGPSDRTRTGNIPFPIVLTALDFLVGMDSTPVFSRFNLHQAANRNPPKTASTFRHAGWMVVTECRSHSRDTGPFRSRPQSIDPLNIPRCFPIAYQTRPIVAQKQWSPSTRRSAEGACAD
jgi:hypothetical protein